MRSSTAPVPCRSRRRFLVGIAGAALATGCASAPPPPRRSLRRLEAGALTVVVEWPAGTSEGAWVLDAINEASRRLARHSLRLREPVLFRVHSSVRSFVHASGRTDAHLRAWAGYATIDALTPAHWRMDSAAVRVSRVTHELVHCALYQAFGSEKAATLSALPFFFVEGTASVVAEQGDRRMPLAMVKERGGKDPLLGGDKLPPPVRYGAAHHAMAALRARFGMNLFSEAVHRAAANPRRGGIEEALFSLTEIPPQSLWEWVADGPARDTHTSPSGG